MLRDWSPLLERIAAASLLVVVLVIIARISTPSSTLASPDERGAVTPATPAQMPRRAVESKDRVAEFALVGELMGQDHIVRIYAGDPLRYTVLDKEGRILCRLERAEVIAERYPEIPLRDLLSTQAPALMRVDPAAADFRY